MTTLTPSAQSQPSERPSLAQVENAIAQSLESLRVTDLVYEDLWHTGPLTSALARAVVDSTASGGAVLVIGGNLHLFATLKQLGYWVTGWQLASQRFEADPSVPVTSTVSPDMPLPEVTEGYDCVVLCLSLEKLKQNPLLVLTNLRKQTAQGTRLVLALEHAGRLGARIAGLRGLGWAPSETTDAGPLADGRISWNWPEGETRWTLSEVQWVNTAKAAGLLLERSAYVLGKTANLRAPSMTLGGYLKAQVRYAIKRAVPKCRDYLLLTLAHAAEQAERVEPHWAQGPLDSLPVERWPLVSIIVEQADYSRMSPMLQALQRQTYPLHRMEVLLGTPAPLAPPSVDTERQLKVRWISGSRAELLETSNGDIVVFLQPQALPTEFWAESAAAAMALGVDMLIGSHLPNQTWLTRVLSDTARLSEAGHYDQGNVFYRKELLGSLSQGDGPAAGSDTAAVAQARALGARSAFHWETLVWLDLQMNPARLLQHWRALASGQVSSRSAPVEGVLYTIFALGAGLAMITRRKRFSVLALPWLLAYGPEATEGLWPPHQWITKLPFRLGMRVMGQGLTLLASTVGRTRKGRTQ